jgi:hypothetical protein
MYVVVIIYETEFNYRDLKERKVIPIRKPKDVLEVVLVILFYLPFIFIFKFARYLFYIPAIFHWIRDSFIGFYCFVLYHVSFVIYVIWDSGLLSGLEDIKNIAVEFHGLFFDIIILGIIFSIYNYYREKRIEIERLNQSLYGYRHIHDLTQKEINDLQYTIQRLSSLKTSHIELEYQTIYFARNWSDNRITFFIRKCTIVDFSTGNLRKSTFVESKIIGLHIYYSISNTKFINCFFVKYSNYDSPVFTGDDLKIKNVRIDFSIFHKDDSIINSANIITEYNFHCIEDYLHLISDDIKVQVENASNYVIAIPNRFNISELKYKHSIDSIISKHYTWENYDLKKT